MLIVYFGRMGKGKTYGMCRQLIEELKKGNHVYVNFDFKVPGYEKQIFRIPFKEAARVFMELNYSKEKREAVLALDEGWIMFDSYLGTKVGLDMRVKFVSLRKHKLVVYMTAQRVTSIHKALRDLVNEFWECNTISFGFIGLRFLRIFRTRLYDLDGSGNLNLYQSNQSGKNIAILDSRHYFFSKKIANSFNTMEDINQMIDVQELMKMGGKVALREAEA